MPRAASTSNDLPLVINFDLPDIPETYVHRIAALAVPVRRAPRFLRDRSERPYLGDIEKLIGKRIPVAVRFRTRKGGGEALVRSAQDREQCGTASRSPRTPPSEVAADVAREKEAKKKARQAESECQASVRREKAAEQQTEQQAKAAAPRKRRRNDQNDRNDSSRQRPPE